MQAYPQCTHSKYSSAKSVFVSSEIAHGLHKAQAIIWDEGKGDKPEMSS